MDNRWTDEERKIVFECVAEHLLYKEIEQELEQNGFYRSTEAIRKMLSRASVEEKTPYVEEVVKVNQVNRNKSSKIFNVVEDIDDVFAQIQEKKKMLLEASNKRFKKLGNPKDANFKILSLSDLHVPFENVDVIQHALDNHGDADVLVINGDLFDMYSVSKWPKNKALLLEHEYKLVFDYIKMFSEKFKEVHITRGNHDNRLRSYFSSHIDPAISFLAHPDAIERVCSGYNIGASGLLEKVCDFDNVHYDGGLYSWYVKIGDAIFAHPNNGTKIPLGTAVKVAEYFLERENFSTVVCGHTHRMSSGYWKNKLVMEQGCCCVPMEYESDAKMQYGVQTFGYAVVYMNEEGQVDFDKSGPVYYGTGSLIHI